jgi:hypothetical protein
MNTKAPPVPPANRSDKGPGEDAHLHDKTHAMHGGGVPDPAKQGQQANTRINTSTHLSTQDR